MIEFTRSYKTSDGQVFGTIEKAQTHELEVSFDRSGVLSANTPTELATLIVSHKDVIVDILTTTPNSKPKARAINGGTKKRAKKVVITNADTDANQIRI